MAEISLIPQNQKKKTFFNKESLKGFKARFSGVSKLSIFLNIVVVVTTIIFFVWNGALNSKVKDLQTVLANVSTERNVSLENELRKTNTRLKSFEGLLNDHRSWSEFLRIIEEKTVIEIAFTELNASYEDGSIILDGISPNYNLLAQQIKSFEQVNGVLKVDTTKININKENQVAFTIIITIDRKIIKKLPNP